ncbi:MAG: hypothetical protein ABUK01_06635 [Leptospirales bacterium]
MKFGEFLIEKHIVSPVQLQEALNIQKDNPTLKLGEVLVAHRMLENNELLKYIQNFMDETGAEVSEMTKWLSQKEADELIQSLKEG